MHLIYDILVSFAERWEIDMSLVFILFTAVLVYIQYRKENNIVNLFSLLMVPYAIIVFLNNFIFYKYGFFRISDNAMIVWMVAFLLFFISGRFAMKTRRVANIDEDQTEFKLDRFDVKAMNRTLVVITIIGSLRLMKGIVNGQLAEGYMSSGIVGHLLSLSFAIVPYVVLYWTYHVKKWQYIVVPLMILALTFASFIKNHVIALMVVIFIFMTMYRKSLLKKAVVILVAVVLGIFVLNYVIGFSMLGVEVQNSFYLYHFWKYCGGALINATNYFAGAMNESIGVMYKLCIYLSALPNMFLHLVNVKIFSSEAFDFSTFVIAENGQATNVVDAITRLYPSDGDFLQVIMFLMVIFVLGFVFMRVYLNGKRQCLSSWLAVFLTYYVFLSFFGTFYMLSGPWETLVWAIIVPKLYLKKTIRKSLKDECVLVEAIHK